MSIESVRSIAADGEVTDITPEDARDLLTAKRAAGQIREFVVTINGHTVTVHKDTHPAEFALLFDAFLGTLEGEP